MTSEEGEVKRVRTEQKGKRTHACGQQCGDSQRKRGCGEVEEGERAINGGRKRLDFGW